jgi:hypothetical protein
MSSNNITGMVLLRLRLKKKCNTYGDEILTRHDVKLQLFAKPRISGALINCLMLSYMYQRI